MSDQPDQPGVGVDADTLAMCQIMCEEARGVAACHLLGALGGNICPAQYPQHQRKWCRVIYSDRFVTQVRDLTGNSRFPLRAVTHYDEKETR